MRLYLLFQVGTDENGKLNGIKITYYDNPGSNPAESDVLYLYVWGDNSKSTIMESCQWLNA